MAPDPNEFPRTIWCAWHQGLENAPEHVRRIVDLWRALNPDYRVEVFEEPNVSDLLADHNIDPSHLTPQVKADILRSVLLKTQGGLWVDATLLPVQGLSRWLDPLMNDTKFFAFTSAGDADLILSNWFLAARRGSCLMSRWCDFYLDYFQTRRRRPSWKRALYHRKPSDFLTFLRYDKLGQRTAFVDPNRARTCFFYPYAVHNYHLSFLLNTDPEVRGEWQDCPTLWHTLPLLMQRVSRDQNMQDSALLAQMVALLDHSPVHKLNYQDDRFLPVVEEVERRAGTGQPRLSSTR